MPTYTAEQCKISYGEEDVFATKPANTNVWIGKRKSVTLPGPDMDWKAIRAGESRDVFEFSKAAILLDGISIPYELQDGKFLLFAFGQVADVGTDVVGGGGSTLDGATVAGATDIDVVAATDYAVDDYIQVDTGSNAEIRKITVIATNNLTLDKKLRRAHATGVTCNEVATPFTHTISGHSSLPSLSLQSIHAKGETNELLRYFQGAVCDGLEISLDEKDNCVVTQSLLASEPVDGTPPGTAPTAVTTKSYKFHEAGYTYFGSALNAVKSFRLSLANNGEMKHWSRTPKGQYAAEYIPKGRVYSLMTDVYARDDDIWDQLLLQAEDLTCTILFTRGASDTFTITATGVLKKAPYDIPEEGEVVIPMEFLPKTVTLVFVDSIPYY
jgi:hypothetical protein